MLQISYVETVQTAVRIGVSKAIGQILHSPRSSVVINLINLGVGRIVHMILTVWRGNEGGDLSELSVSWCADLIGQIVEYPLRRFDYVVEAVEVVVAGDAPNF